MEGEEELLLLRCRRIVFETALQSALHRQAAAFYSSAAYALLLPTILLLALSSVFGFLSVHGTGYGYAIGVLGMGGVVLRGLNEQLQPRVRAPDSMATHAFASPYGTLRELAGVAYQPCSWHLQPKIAHCGRP